MPRTSILGFVACRYTSNLLGIGPAERLWGDVKHLKTNKLSHISAEKVDKKEIIYTTARLKEARQRRIEKEKLIEFLNTNLSQSAWIDGHCHLIHIQKKAINEAIKWLDDAISKDDDLRNSTGKSEMYQMIKEIYNVIIHPNNVEYE